MVDPGNVSPKLGFFAELRRRRVIRVAVVYGVAGWVVIEVASTLLPGLHLPEWTVTFVIALVVLGFPIAVLMGWMFDIGPGGVQRTATEAGAPAVVAPVAPIEAKNPVADPRPPQAPAPTPRLPPATDEDRRTIAVLPFVNMSGDVENEYFSDGISEEILNLLAKLPQLKVASRTSSFNLKGERIDIPTVARQLGVGTVLEGSVRRAGERVRITAQLIEADSDSHLWSETYDREMMDVFAIQDDIAQSIV
jgi:adenylate cyclase